MGPPALGGVRAMRGCVGAVIEVHDDGLLVLLCTTHIRTGSVSLPFSF